MYHNLFFLSINPEKITPDQTILLQWGAISFNATLIFTWIVMLIMIIGSWLITRKLSASTRLSDGQNFLEVIVLGIGQQIYEISQKNPSKFISFVGTLFLFIAISNFLTLIPEPLYQAPTASLSTTSALAICVLIAVPFYGIKEQGLKSYLKQYLQPTPFMLPFNIISEFSRTLALAIRLFGNMLSGSMIIGILLLLAPLIVPVIMQIFGLLTGIIQAYIFAVLAMVFIAAGMDVQNPSDDKIDQDDLTLEELKVFKEI
jgi:F-type H+-transporting ATPase subunit a